MAIEEILRSLPMFNTLTDKEKKKLTEKNLTPVRFKKGETVIREGETCQALFALLKGTVLVTKAQDDAQIRLAKLGAGEIFGEMSFFSRGPRKSNVVANDDVVALKMDQQFFDALDGGIRDKVKNYFIELLIRRLDSMNESIMKISKLMRS